MSISSYSEHSSVKLSLLCLGSNGVIVVLNWFREIFDGFILFSVVFGRVFSFRSSSIPSDCLESKGSNFVKRNMGVVDTNTTCLQYLLKFRYWRFAHKRMEIEELGTEMQDEFTADCCNATAPAYATAEVPWHQ